MKKCVEDLEKGTYNSNVKNNLSAKQRTGTIQRKDCCEAWFPDMYILDFINLPYEHEEYEKMLPKITWLDEQEQK